MRQFPSIPEVDFPGCGDDLNYGRRNGFGYGDGLGYGYGTHGSGHGCGLEYNEDPEDSLDLYISTLYPVYPLKLIQYWR